MYPWGFLVVLFVAGCISDLHAPKLDRIQGIGFLRHRANRIMVPRHAPQIDGKPSVNGIQEQNFRASATARRAP
jgi:hypothetical protein